MLTPDPEVPDLMIKKRRVVASTPELARPLAHLELLENSPLMLCSDQYCQIGCDLRRLSVLEETLSKVCSLSDSEFLFIAEVSITYLETAAADSLIRKHLLLAVWTTSRPSPFVPTPSMPGQRLTRHMFRVGRYPGRG